MSTSLRVKRHIQRFLKTRQHTQVLVLLLLLRSFYLYLLSHPQPFLVFLTKCHNLADKGFHKDYQHNQQTPLEEVRPRQAAAESDVLPSTSPSIARQIQ
uniref:Uncharacterized protein n=1 Tax=Rhizophora mucronata TaxID=61149 RepID=A0A2P2QQG5_RHIMU